MSSNYLAKSSFIKINADSQTVSGSFNFMPLTIGIVEGRSFSGFVSILVFSDVMSTPGPAQGHRSRVRSRTCPPQTSQ